MRSQGTGSQNIPLTASEIVGIGGSFTLNLVNNKNINSKKTVEGSPYLFESWDNNAKVYLEDKVVVMNRSFKRYLNPKYQRNSYFEEILKSKNFLLLRKYYTTLREPNVNPMTKMPEGLPELLQNEDFCVLKTDNEKLKKIKFRKKSVFEWISKNQQKMVQSYVKENNQKFNNLQDIVSILKYYIALSA